MDRTDSKIDKPLPSDRSRHVRPGQIYFIRCGKRVKIGFSTRPLDRLKGLQTSHPDKLEIIGTMPGSMKLEGEIHDLFKRWRVRGEWFEASRTILAYIDWNTGNGAAKEHDRRIMPVADPVLIKQLLGMRSRHGAGTPIGYRCSNMIEKFRARAECRDPIRAAMIENNMRREIAEIAALQGR